MSGILDNIALMVAGLRRISSSGLFLSKIEVLAIQAHKVRTNETTIYTSTSTRMHTWQIISRFLDLVLWCCCSYFHAESWIIIVIIQLEQTTTMARAFRSLSLSHSETTKRNSVGRLSKRHLLLVLFGIPTTKSATTLNQIYIRSTERENGQAKASALPLHAIYHRTLRID